MGDWRNTQYRLGPKPDPLNDPMAGENLLIGFGLWAVIIVFVGSAIGLVWSLFF